MATKNTQNGQSVSKSKSFNRGSKMRKYNQVFDEDVQQMRAASYNKNLYKMGETVRSDDVIWSVEPGFEFRTDLVSTKFYGTAKYDWLIEDINNIKDPIKDLTIGLKLILPSISRMMNLV